MRGFNLSTAFFFELAICLTVLGSLSLILDAMGRPSRQQPLEEGKTVGQMDPEKSS
jgi:hypothetical protein